MSASMDEPPAKKPCPQLTGIYWNAETGSDENSGLSMDQPVRSQERAVELARGKNGQCLGIRALHLKNELLHKFKNDEPLSTPCGQPQCLACLVKNGLSLCSTPDCNNLKVKQRSVCSRCATSLPHLSTVADSEQSKLKVRRLVKQALDKLKAARELDPRCEFVVRDNIPKRGWFLADTGASTTETVHYFGNCARLRQSIDDLSSNMHHTADGELVVTRAPPAAHGQRTAPSTTGPQVTGGLPLPSATQTSIAAFNRHTSLETRQHALDDVRAQSLLLDGYVSYVAQQARNVAYQTVARVKKDICPACAPEASAASAAVAMQSNAVAQQQQAQQQPHDKENPHPPPSVGAGMDDLV